MSLVLCGQYTLLPAAEEDWHIDQLIESFTSFFVQSPNTRTACLVGTRHTMDIQQWQHHFYPMIPVSSKEQTSLYPLMCSVGTVVWRKEAHVEDGAVSTMKEAREADLWGHKDLKEEAFLGKCLLKFVISLDIPNIMYILNSHVYYGSSLVQVWLAASQVAWVFFFPILCS